MLRIAVDFDGTVAAGNGPPVLRPLAAQVLQGLRAKGFVLVLHSCRCNPIDPDPVAADEASTFWRSGALPARVVEHQDRFEEMRSFLRAQGLWELFGDVWQAPGKPLADLYLDDRGDRPDWQAVARDFGVVVS